MTFSRRGVLTTYARAMLITVGLANSASPQKEATMSTAEKNIQVMLQIFQAIEHRDPNHVDLEKQRLLFQPDVELHWPSSLPYGGVARGLTRTGPNWEDTWNPLQPTAAERRMNPRIVAASDKEVVILWLQRGLSPKGIRFETEVLGLYELRAGKLARAQMFYFDEVATSRFLAEASTDATRAEPAARTPQ